MLKSIAVTSLVFSLPWEPIPPLAGKPLAVTMQLD